MTVVPACSRSRPKEMSRYGSQGRLRETLISEHKEGGGHSGVRPGRRVSQLAIPYHACERRNPIYQSPQRHITTPPLPHAQLDSDSAPPLVTEHTDRANLGHTRGIVYILVYILPKMQVRSECSNSDNTHTS